MRQKHYIPCHCDGLDQLLFGTLKFIIYQMKYRQNYFQMKCCQGILNSKFHSG